MKIKGTDKPNSHWCSPSDYGSGRPHPQRPPSLKIQKERLDPFYQCCVRNGDTNILGSDLDYAGTELLVILNKRNFQVPKDIIYKRLQIPHLLKLKPVLSPRFQTNLWSLNCTNTSMHNPHYISFPMEAKIPGSGWLFP